MDEHIASLLQNEKRTKILNASSCVWSPPESREDQWLEKHNQLKESHNDHGHARAKRSNVDKFLVEWAHKQRQCCKWKTKKGVKLDRVCLVCKISA